jgi:hypothetical protein
VAPRETGRPATAQQPARSPNRLLSESAEMVAERPDTQGRETSLAELVELTGATPGEVIAALWELREQEQRP